MSETRLKKVRIKRRPVMMGKAHCPSWASHLQLRPEQESALIWGGLKLPPGPSPPGQDPQTINPGLNIQAGDRSIETLPKVIEYYQPPAAPRCTKHSIPLCLRTFSSLCLEPLPFPDPSSVLSLPPYYRYVFSFLLLCKKAVSLCGRLTGMRRRGH